MRSLLLLPLAIAVAGIAAAGCGPAKQDEAGLFNETSGDGRGSPDLAVRNFSVSPTTLRTGEELTIAFQVANVGAGASPPTRVGVYLSDHPTITASDTLEGTMDLPSVGPGASISITAKGRAGQTEGLFYIGVFADDINRVLDVDRSNNVASVAVVVSGR